MGTFLIYCYILATLVNSYWFMTARFNKGLSQDIGLSVENIATIVNPSSLFLAILATISSWCIFLIPIFFISQEKFILGIFLLIGIFILPRLICSAINHPKYFAKKALKNLNSERNYRLKNIKNNKKVTGDEVELYKKLLESTFNPIQNRLEILIERDHTLPR